MLFAVLNHLQKVRAVVVGTRHSSVYVGSQYENVVVFGILVAYTELSFD